MAKRAARRRAQGTGSVYYDSARGRWVGEVTIGDERRRVFAVGNKTDRMVEGDCKRRLRELIDAPAKASSRAGGASVGSSTVGDSVKVFLERDLPARRRAGRPVAPSTVTGYRWACGLIVGGLGWVRLADLGVEHVEQFYDHLATGDNGPSAASSLRKVRTTLHQVLAVAVRRGWIGQNVAAAAMLPDAAAAKPRRALNPAQARTLLETLRSEPNGLMFALSLRLGLRPGEASALTWADVERGDERAVLHVRRGRRAVGGKVGVVNELKTAASRRQIELPPDLDEWVGACRRAAFGDVIRLRPDEALMFPSPTGRVLDPSNMRRELAAICRRAGVPTVRPNELRHSCASLLSDEGVPNEEIADLLGHTTTRMVDQTYRHRLRPVVDIAARARWAVAK